MNIRTNLGLMVNGLLMDAPVSEDTTPVKVVDLKEGKKQDKVLKAWEELGRELFDTFKEQKGTSTMAEIKTKFKNKFNYLNKNIKFEDITYETNGVYIRAIYNGKRIAQLSTQNAKLLPNEFGQGFLLWSILGHVTCNGKTKLCSGNCYNNCKSFGGHVTLKIDCLITTQLDIFEKIIEKMITFSPHKETFVRIHEDGDFYDMKYFEKWVNIAKNNKNMTFEAYTKEPKLLKKINSLNSEIENLVLRFSVMEDTDIKTIEYINKNNIPNYTCLGVKRGDKNAKEVFEYIAVKNRCVGTCKYCKKCYRKGNVTIVTKMH